MRVWISCGCGRNSGWLGLAAGLILGAHCLEIGAAEPLAVAGRPGPAADALWSWLDPLEGTPEAAVEDPSGRLSSEARHAVVLTEQPDPLAAGQPRLRVLEALPEFWEQPSIWGHFQKGPGAFSGFRRDLQPRDWAGRRTTDRRAYALDPGLEAEPTPATYSPPGAGSLGLSTTGDALQLGWSGVSGRVYQVEYSPALGQPFQVLQRLLPATDGTVALDLPRGGSQGFYRVAEIKP